MKTITILLGVSLLLMLNCCNKDEYKDLDCSTIKSSYASNIAPIITANCNTQNCHDAGAIDGDFTTYDGLKDKVLNGSLIKRVIFDKTMPAAGALSLDDRKKIKCWIENGAPNN